MCSDSYKEIKEEVDGIQADEDNLLIVQAKYITVGGGDGGVDIGAGNAFGGGGEDEGPADEGTTVINLVEAHKLQEQEFSQKDFMSIIKALLKRTVGLMKEEGKEADVIKAF